jgi:hypothetical protein
MFEELLGHHGADRVAAPVIGSRLARTVPVETGDRIPATGLEVAAEHVAMIHGSSIASSITSLRRGPSTLDAPTAEIASPGS